MRLSIFGARGVPARWGGWDTIVTELDAAALQARAAVACRERVRDYYAWDKCARDHDRFFRWLADEVEDYADSF